MRRRLTDQRGMALMGVLAIIIVLTTLSAMLLYLVGKDLGLSAVRTLGAQSLQVAEGGAVAGRAGLLVLMNADPAGFSTMDPSLDGTTLATWWNGGASAATQDAFAVFNYIVLDGLSFSLATSSATNFVDFEVDWGAATPHRKLRVATGTPPANPLGTGSYAATVRITRRQAPDPTGVNPNQLYIHRLSTNPATYEFYYTYTVESLGTVPPLARRLVSLSRDFSVQVTAQSFAQYALFTHVHTTPGGSAIWFTGSTGFDGPVHTNGQFRFAFFPRFGTPDSGSPCDPTLIGATPLTSVSTTAWYNNNGSPVQLAQNENVPGGVRRDAAVLPDCTPGSTADDNDNPAANFTRGVASIAFPDNSYSQQGVAIGRNPTNQTAVTNLEIRQSIPELADDSSSIPDAIYVPVVDANGNGVSNAGEDLAGGIYVDGDLTSLTMAPGGSDTDGDGDLDQMVYTMVAGSQNVTVTVNRATMQTTVYNSAWSSPQTRTFDGVPKGYQAGPGNTNAGIIYVNGNINSVSGTLEENEQTTIAASGRIDITNHIRYEDPPIVTDPNDNPINVLGLYSAGNDIRITTAAPNDLDLHAVLMSGIIGDGNNSSVNVQNYNSGSPRGTVRLIGGIIEEYYGAFGTFNPSTGALQTGYGREFKFDRRMTRGFSPPYFPTTDLFVMANSTGLASAPPNWREQTPP